MIFMRSQALALSAGLALWALPAAAQEAKPAEPQEGQAAAPPRPAPPDPASLVPPARPADVASMDAIVAALYDVISGDAGVERDWDRFRSLFHPGARVIPTGKNAKTGKVVARIASPEDYIRANEAFLEGEGFHEVELGRHSDSFGGLVQVFSAYEARNKLTDDKPFLRGINSIQLFNDGKRWWVLSLAWTPETPENPLPDEFAKKPAAEAQ